MRKRPSARQPREPRRSGATRRADAATATASRPPRGDTYAGTFPPTTADAKTFRERGIFAYRGGDLPGALAISTSRSNRIPDLPRPISIAASCFTACASSKAPLPTWRRPTADQADRTQEAGRRRGAGTAGGDQDGTLPRPALAHDRGTTPSRHRLLAFTQSFFGRGGPSTGGSDSRIPPSPRDRRPEAARCSDHPRHRSARGVASAIPPSPGNSRYLSHSIRQDALRDVGDPALTFRIGSAGKALRGDDAAERLRGLWHSAQ